MMNLSTIDPTVVSGVKAIAFREPVFNGPSLTQAHFRIGTVLPPKLRGATRTARRVTNIPGDFFRRHRREQIRQVKELAGGPDRRKITASRLKKYTPALPPWLT